MTAPAEIHCVTGEIQTKLPGITFGSTFPKLAAMADRFTIVRSYGSGQSGHTYGEVVSARNPSGASISSIYARVRGNNHPETGLPTNVLVLPARFVGVEEGRAILRAWLDTPFAGGRHARRVEKIERPEQPTEEKR